MRTYLNIAQIILGVVLVGLILLEVQSSGTGGVFGGRQTSLVRKRRGAELLLFRITVGVSVFFFLISVANVVVAR
jgi:protein translocase SecG subunit